MRLESNVEKSRSSRDRNSKGRERLRLREILLLVGAIVISSGQAFTSTRTLMWSRNRSFSRLSTPLPLSVAKSGGKMILTEEMYSEFVLSRDVPRPVLVFFSAPWYESLFIYLYTGGLFKKLMTLVIFYFQVRTVSTDKPSRQGSYETICRRNRCGRSLYG